MAGRISRIRILIETLTGTLFELLVSRQDTILSIKWRIYRIEGIPVSQQHLLFRLEELDDNVTLFGANIAEGSTLKLVISMRGGPIATRRTLKNPNYDESWVDCKEFLESDESRKNGRYRLELHHDGSSVSIFRIARSYEATDSPNISEDSPDLIDDHDWALDKMRENICTLTKMRDLRKKMETLQLKRNKNADKSNAFSSKLRRSKFSNASKSSTEIISEELELLGLVSKCCSNSIRKMRNLQNGQANYIVGLTPNKYPLDANSTRRSREDSDSLDETRITQVTRRRRGERLPTPEGLVAGARSVCFQSESELSLELALSDEHEEPLKLLATTACPVPSTTAGDHFRMSCLLLPSGDSARPQVSPEDLSTREEPLETFSMQLESPKLHMDSPVSTKINLSDSIECLEIGNHKSYPNLKSSSYDVFSQYLQNETNPSHEQRINSPVASHSRFEPPPLQRSSRSYFQSNPALHQLHNDIHNAQCSSTSNLDKTKDVYFNDDFQHSCSTSNLEKLNTKKFEMPQLTRHSNTEYLDYTGSYENLDRVRISKRRVVNMMKNRGLNRSSESLSKINEHTHMHPPLSLRNRLSRRSAQGEYMKSFEGLNSISCEAQPLLNKDEHKIIKIPNNAMLREDMLLHKACYQNRYTNSNIPSKTFPVIHTLQPKTISRVTWGSTGGTPKRPQKNTLVILEAPTLKNTESTSSSSHTVSSTKTKERSSSEKSPPAEESTESPAGEPVAKKKRVRCKVCGKRLTITTAMVCRCGGTFCALHRYAETHNCTYDYKEEGRKQIEQDNPVVTAPKLPKI